MTYNWIIRESTFAAHLFLWVLLILEYIEVSMKLAKLGMKKIE